MKFRLIFITLFLANSLEAQIAHLQCINKLVVDPSVFEIESIPFAQVIKLEYSGYYETIEKLILEEKEYEAQDKLREEQDILLEIIESWEEVLGESVAIQYLDQYVEGYCYAFNMEGLILFSEDLKVEESYIEPETFSSNLQFKYQFIPKSGQWVRKKKSPNCYSQNPDDCYIACYEETTPGF